MGAASRERLALFFLFISSYSQFVQFGHLVEFFNSYINMSVATSSGVPSSRLLGYFSLLSIFKMLIVRGTDEDLFENTLGSQHVNQRAINYANGRWKSLNEKL